MSHTLVTGHRKVILILSYDPRGHVMAIPRAVSVSHLGTAISLDQHAARLNNRRGARKDDCGGSRTL